MSHLYTPRFRFRKTYLSSLLILTGLCLAVAGSAQIEYEKATLYGTGTVYESYAGACGQTIPGTEGLLSFCDGKDNLIVLRESRGLGGRGIKQILPSAIDYEVATVTNNGVSIKSDKGWINVPNRAFQRPTAEAELLLGTAFTAQAGLINGANQLLMFWSAGFGLVDLNTMQAKRFGSIRVSNGFVTPFLGVYDARRATTWIIGQSGISNVRSLYQLKDGEDVLSFVNTFSATNLGQWTSGQSEIYLRGDSLFVTTLNNGLYILDIRDPSVDVPVAHYVKSLGNLPLLAVADLGFSSVNGDLFLVGTNAQRQGRLVRLNLATGRADTLIIDRTSSASAIGLREIAVGPDDLLSVSGDGSNSIYDVDWSGATPTVTENTPADFEAAGFPYINSPTDITYRDGAFFYSFPNTSAATTTSFFEVITRRGNVFGGFNDDSPGALSERTLNRFTDVAAGTNGEVYFVNSFDAVIARVRDGQVAADYRQRPANGLAITDAVGRLYYKDASTLEMLDPPLVRTLGNARNAFSAFAAYGQQLWAYSPNDKSIYIFDDGALVRTSPVNPDLPQASIFDMVVDTAGIAWLVRFQSNSNVDLIKHDISTGVSEQLIIENDVLLGRLFKVLAAPEGGIWMLGATAPAYFDGKDLKVFDRTTYPELSGARDGVVTTDGKLHMISRDEPIIATLSGAQSSEPVLTVSQVEREEFPLFDLYRAGTITFDSEGDLWISGQRDIGFLEFDLADTASVFRPGGASRFMTGQVYYDRNTNSTYDEGEGAAAITVAIVQPDGSVTNTATDASGRYEYLLSGYTGPLRVVLPRLPQYTRALSRVESVTISAGEADLVGVDFVLESIDYSSLYLQTANKTGAWGFDRPGFRNAFTAGITNLSRTETFRQVAAEFAYVNASPGAAPLPVVKSVALYRVRPLGAGYVFGALSIDPKTHAWRINASLRLGRDYAIDTLTADFSVAQGRDTVRVTTNIARLDPRETYVFEILTERYQATANGGSRIKYGYSGVNSTDLDSPRPPANGIFLRPNSDDGGDGGVDNPYRDGNSPYIDPNNVYTDPYSPPPYTDPSDIYADPPFETPLFSSYDPNDKLVDGGVAVCAAPDSDPNAPVEECANVTPLTQRDLVYTIRFENEGNFSAKDVYIIDTFDTKLDANSINVLSTSHPMALEFLPMAGDSTVVRFAFRDIYLPFEDSVNDGLVRFVISTDAEPVAGQEVRNTASIYFDQNPPIVTNTIRNLYREVSSLREAVAPIELTAYPNPTTDEVTLVASERIEAVEVYDVRGAKVLSPKPGMTLSLGVLPKGVYVVRVMTAGGVGVVRVVKG